MIPKENELKDSNRKQKWKHKLDDSFIFHRAIDNAKEKIGGRRQFHERKLIVSPDNPTIAAFVHFVQKGTIKHGDSVPTTEIEVKERQQESSVIIIAHSIIEPYAMVIVL